MRDDEKAIFTKAVFAMSDELKRKAPDWDWLEAIGEPIGRLCRKPNKPLDPTRPTRYGNG